MCGTHLNYIIDTELINHFRCFFHRTVVNFPLSDEQTLTVIVSLSSYRMPAQKNHGRSLTQHHMTKVRVKCFTAEQRIIKVRPFPSVYFWFGFIDVSGEGVCCCRDMLTSILSYGQVLFYTEHSAVMRLSAFAKLIHAFSASRKHLLASSTMKFNEIT